MIQQLFNEIQKIVAILKKDEIEKFKKNSLME